MLRVADDLVEVDHSVEVRGISDPLIHCLPVRFVRGSGMVVVRSDKWSQGRADDFDAAGVRARDDLFIGCGHSGKQYIVVLLRWVGGAGEQANVVDSFKGDQVLNARLRDHIRIDAGQGIGSQAIGEQMVPSDTLIENSKIVCAGLR